jgi:hypothetical protein
MAHYVVVVQIKEVDKKVTRTGGVVSSATSEERTVEDVYTASIRKETMVEAVAAAQRLLERVSE